MIISDKLVLGSIARWERSQRPRPSTLSLLAPANGHRQVTPNQRNERYAQLLKQTGDPALARLQLERIIEGNDLTGVNYLAIGTLRSRSVCRVRLRDATGRTLGYGTGFLVAPGILMTNHHVIADADGARFALAEFQYQYDVNGDDEPVVTFAIQATPAPVTNEGLDFCFAAVSPHSVDGRRRIEEFGWLPLDPTPGKAIVGEYLTIIQHPSGERKQICVRENKLIKYDDTGNTLWYTTDTTAGSSGSPVFNDAWQVVAIHHMGVPATNAAGQWLTVDGGVWDQSMDETRVKWLANEGVRVSSIDAFLRSSYANDPIAHAVLSTSPPPRPQSGGSELSVGGGGQPTVSDGEIRLTIPVSVSLKVDTSALRPSASVAPPQMVSVPPSLPSVLAPTTNGKPVLLPRVIEKVDVDQSNYDERPGYDVNFLGKGKLAIPLPTVTAAKWKKSVLTFGGETELKYWNYSLVMNKDRRLAFLSAINVDGGLRKGKRDADGDKWFYDTRIPKKAQLGDDFYPKQSTFEVDRTANPFDRGHLSARNDAQWGDTAAEAKRNGDDSFHWVNCSPQHYLFNQGQKLWAGLEGYVISDFAKDSDGKASVFNGPIFDAPLSSAGPGGRPVLNLKGDPHPDPTFGGVSIPKMFFKVVATERDGRLAIAAFIISQEDLLARIDRIAGMPPLPEERLTEAEAKAFQVPLADIARLTGLDFGPLIAADRGNEELFSVRGPVEVRTFDDILQKKFNGTPPRKAPPFIEATE
jgi:endonuclease G